MIHFITGFFVLTWGMLIGMMLVGCYLYPKVASIIVGTFVLCYLLGLLWNWIFKTTIMDWV